MKKVVLTSNTKHLNPILKKYKSDVFKQGQIRVGKNIYKR